MIRKLNKTKYQALLVLPKELLEIMEISNGNYLYFSLNKIGKYIRITKLDAHKDSYRRKIMERQGRFLIAVPVPLLKNLGIERNAYVSLTFKNSRQLEIRKAINYENS